ncbi:MAG: imidazoleglycerol-phosphate dehydratase [Methanothrix sp.]|nr:imidazoleglycerol-phosphate dehydratase [Methanothrix sp.]MDD4447628.1 imidazoleglycerol-phosphate dehydratase [Methanothrix sp.]
MRKGEAQGLFRECKARACLDLDGSGKATVNTGSGFLDHMLTALARTALLDLTGQAEPGFYKMQALGEAIGLSLDASLGERIGIRRYGSSSVPMDEALADVALDFSGRPYLVMTGEFQSERIGDLEAQLLQPFLEALCVGARLTLHVRFYGENDHHKAESIFKALGFAIREAVTKEGTGVPSTKGVI